MSLRPDARGEPVGRVVAARHHLVEIVERLHREHRPEDLLAHDPHLVLHAVEDGRAARSSPCRGPSAAPRRPRPRARPAPRPSGCRSRRDRTARARRAGPSRWPGRSRRRAWCARATSATRSTISSRTFGPANRREPAQQHWPWLKKIAFATPAAAASTSASSKTITGDLPPSSSDTRFRLPADAFTISCPTSVLPVKATLSTPGCAASAAPASPWPVTTLTTPSGKPDLADQLRQPQRRERRLLGGLEHHGVAAGERRAELPGRHQQREVPRDDLAHHARPARAACSRGRWRRRAR